MKKLKIQTLIDLHGFQNTVDELNLHVSEKGNLVLLKYKQIEADWSKEATHECRGLILDAANHYNVVSYPYEKFFNISEGYCADIDWDTAKVYEKADGSLANLYYYNDKWNVQTSGTIDADNRTNHVNYTFADLFWLSVEKMYGDKDTFLAKLNKNYNYMFELCTPYNIVVVPHNDFKIKLHGVRDMRSYEYVDIDTIDLVKVKTYDINSLDQINELIGTMDWTEEGFVVCDANFNRAKIKNPSYVAVHHTATKTSPYAIMNVIKENEIDEFLAYFKHHEEEVMMLKEKWDDTLVYIQNFYDSINHIEDKKEFALEAQKFDKKYVGIIFSLRNKHIETVHEGMCRIHNRDWYNKFNENEK